MRKQWCCVCFFFFSSRRRHTRYRYVTGVQTCALPIFEELPENRVRMTVQVPSHDVHHAVEHAASDLAERVKIPGFRKGKVPHQVLVQNIGRERLMTEAVESHIGGWFWNAATQTRV